MGQLCSCTRSQTANKYKLPVSHTTILPAYNNNHNAAVRASHSTAFNQFTPSQVCDVTNHQQQQLRFAIGNTNKQEQQQVLPPRLQELPSQDDVITATTSRPMCSSRNVMAVGRDVIRSTTDEDDVTTASSAATSSSMMTSDCGMTSDTDNEGGAGGDTLRPPMETSTGSSLSRAHVRLSAVLRKLLELVVDDVDGHVIFAVDRLLRRVEVDRVTSPATVTSFCSAGGTCGLLERLECVVRNSGLGVGLEIVVEALRQSLETAVGGGATGKLIARVIELLQTVEVVVRFIEAQQLTQQLQHRVTTTRPTTTTTDDSDDEADSDSGDDDDDDDETCCQCSCALPDDYKDIDLQVTSGAVDDVIYDATLSRRLDSSRRVRSRSRDLNNSRLRLHGTGAPDDVTSGQGWSPTMPLLSVRLSGWCLCQPGHVFPVRQLIASCGWLCDLALVKVDLSSSLSEPSSWLVEALRMNSTLVRLDLRLSSVGQPRCFELLGTAVSRHPRLRVLNVSGTGLTDDGLARLLRMLATNRTLTDIDIGFNDLSTGNGCTAVGDTLRRRSPPLRRLRMRNNGITWSVDHVGTFLLSVGRSWRLRHLDLASNSLCDAGIQCLADALIVNRSLRDVNIDNCSFGVGGCVALARALRANCSLRVLQVSRNNIRDDGFIAIVDGLRYNRSLTTLAANQCNIGNIGLERLLAALRHNGTIRTVKLCYNQIGSCNRYHNVSQSRYKQRLHSFIEATPIFQSSFDSCSSRFVDDDDLSSTRDYDVISGCGSVFPPEVVGVDSASSVDVRALPSDVTSGRDDADIRSVSTSDVADVTAANVLPVSLSELYGQLREVLHSNGQLKILLWGNRMDSWLTEHT